MTSAPAIPNPTGHPARYSGAIVNRLREALFDHYPDPDSRPSIFDPFAGTGERLAELLGEEFRGSGIELHREFIVNRKLVKFGDATKSGFYPTRRFVIVTSPVYPNGMAEAWKVSDTDTSKRNTYAAALARLGGKRSFRSDMSVLGYRGTKPGGRSVKRANYWAIADQAVACWTANPQCVEVYVNVSDFKSGGDVEPFVQDWRNLLRFHGWKIKATYRVRTPRHRGNANADQRLAYEAIVLATR